MSNLIDDHLDDHVDRSIEEFVDIDSLTSFFLLAGAGTGKTRTLVNTLIYLEKRIGRFLMDSNRKVAVITYTNAACDEVKSRVHYNSNFSVSTIHSFSWSLIEPFSNDIREWLNDDIEMKINDLNTKNLRKATEANQIKLEKMELRKEQILKAPKFIYSPESNNYEWNAINHSEVLKICAHFINEKPVFCELLINRHPIIFVDECQDTSKELGLALISLSEKYSKRVSIGFFGDTMQRVYMDGIYPLEKSIPESWEKPIKVMNHRSSKRIVKLSNMIRGNESGLQQIGRTDANTGFVRMFIIDTQISKEGHENKVCSIMKSLTGDNGWEFGEVKKLILEHRMAASRLGFINFFDPLSNIQSMKMSLLEGSIPEVKLIGNVITKLLYAYKKDCHFDVMTILKKHSHKMNQGAFSNTSEKNDSIYLATLSDSIDNLMLLWNEGSDPICLDILKKVYEEDLFKLPTRVKELFSEEGDSDSEVVIALRKSLSLRYSELMKYYNYVTGLSDYDTHQGVKGLEFDRVLVVIDDDESKGHLYKYNKLFGISPLTGTDQKNIDEGKDNSVDRVKRLFYVACTRAKESLALVIYTSDVCKTKDAIIKNGWVDDEEIIIIDEKT